MGKRFILSLILILSLHFTVFSLNVSKEKAEITARNYYFEKTGVKQSQIKFENIIDYKLNNQLVFFVFDVEGKNGFVMISAEDNYYPVIGYSDKNEFSINNVPNNVKGFYNYLGEKILFAKNHISRKTQNKIQILWNKYTKKYSEFQPSEKAKSALLQTATWNQSGGYDDWLPFDDDGTPPTGCVATAMGIVMKYWNYPLQGNSSTSYYEYPYGTLSADFGNSRYFWNLMPENSANTFVAHLLYHCGVAVHMNYDLAGSGSYVVYGNNSAYNALKNYFRYSTDINYKYQDNYSDTQWKQFLKDEIDNGRVVLYRGSGPDGGHAWVCDGYNDSDLFHYNMGWGGYNNGYYDINNISGFNSDFAAVMNIHPSSTNTYSGAPQNLQTTLDESNFDNFTVNLTWDAPAVKSISGYKIYRIDYDNESFHHVYTQIDEVSSSTLTYTDNTGNPGNKEYLVQAIYSDGEGEAVADYLQGTFGVTFRVHDADGNLLTNNGINCQVIFEGTTQSTGFGSASFNNIIFGAHKLWTASADGYPTTSGYVDIPGNSTFDINLTGNVGINENYKDYIQLYPNPAVNTLYIKNIGTNNKVTYQIFDISGKIIKTGTVNSDNSLITIKELAKGYYFINIGINTERKTLSFIKQ